MKSKKKVAKTKKNVKSGKKTATKSKKVAKKTPTITTVEVREGRFQSLNDMVANLTPLPTPTLYHPSVGQWLSESPQKSKPEFTTDPCGCGPDTGCLDTEPKKEGSDHAFWDHELESSKSTFWQSIKNFFGFRS